MTYVRDASTLILVAGSEMASAPPKVLFIKRGSGSNYLPDAFAFPGGNFDKSDEHIDWLSIIPSEDQEIHPNAVFSPATQIPRTLSLRITAIRETFEECGILLCKTYNSPKSDKVTPLFMSDNKRWRHRIRDNSYEFLNLCRSYHCYPDVKNLYLVSNWITPPVSISPRRYDCKFFVAVTDHVVDGDVDTTEVQSMEVGIGRTIYVGGPTGALSCRTENNIFKEFSYFPSPNLVVEKVLSSLTNFWIHL